MTDIKIAFDTLKQRLESMRSDFETELATLASGLDEACGAVDALQAADGDHGRKLRQLEERAEGQSELIETLTQEAQEARALRHEVRERDLEVERLRSELESKKELIRALRHQLDEVDQLKATAKQRDKKIFEQQHELDRKQKELEAANDQLEAAKEQIARLESEIEAESERKADETAVDTAELGALRSELEARKTMIRSLRADADRAAALETQLDDKREAISALEGSIDHHVATIAELRRSVEAWKKKYEAAKGERVSDRDETLAEPPEFTDTEIEALKALDGTSEVAPDRTVAIDMRDALKEARRKRAGAESKVTS